MSGKLPTASQKLETTSSKKKESALLLEHIAKNKLNGIDKIINSMKNEIQSIEKKNLETLANRINSNQSSVINSASPTHSTIDSIINISSKKPTCFSFSYSTHGESNCQLQYYLLNRKMSLKDGFNTSFQHAFFD